MCDIFSCMTQYLKCSKCKQEKPVNEFQPEPIHCRARGYSYQCKECRKAYKNNPKYKAYQSQYGKENLAVYRENAARRRREALTMLGGRCECCGESEYKFLAIDHINGLHHRDRTESGNALVNKVRKNPDAKKLYRILCHNCNSAIGFYGSCPHKD